MIALLPQAFGGCVEVQGEDYRYRGIVVGYALQLSGALRYVVEDGCGRLSIHNAQQLGKPEGWLPGAEEPTQTNPKQE